MSDEQPNTSGAPPANNQPPSKTVRRRRPTAIPSDDSPRNEVKILRPSEVPQREPLPEYSEPKDERRIVPKDVPLELLHEIETEDCKNIVIPTEILTDDVFLAASQVEGLISFRSTNFIEPEKFLEEKQKTREQMEKERHEFSRNNLKSFYARNKHFIGKSIYGCTTYCEDEALSNWNVVLEAPSNCIYEGGTYFLTIKLDDEPDSSLPRVRFSTLLFHPSLSKDGHFDMRGLRRYWNSTPTLDIVYKFLVGEMENIKEIISGKTIAQLENMSQPNISKLASDNWDEFEEIARSVSEKFAGASLSNSSVVRANMTSVYDEKCGWKFTEMMKEEEIDVVG